MTVGHIAQMALVQSIPDPLNGHLRSVINSLQLTPLLGWGGYTDIDFGTPDVDAVSTPYNDRSGTYNETRFYRESAVSISMVLLDGWFPPLGAEAWPAKMNRSSYWLQRLGYWCHPGFRSQLYWKYTGRDETFWMNLVGNGQPNAIELQQRSHRYTQLSFVNPDGRIYKFDPAYDEQADTELALKDGRSRRVIHYGGTEVGEFSLPVEFPLAFDEGLEETFTSNVVEYEGTTPASIIARFYSGTSSYLYNARLNIEHVATGTRESIGFSNDIAGPQGAAKIPARVEGGTAQFVEVDTGTGTVYMNADPNSRQNNYLTTPLDWPTLKPGTNRITFTTNAQPNGSASPAPDTDAYVEVTWYESYIS